MDKGTRVKVVKGKKNVGLTGTIFWLGDNRWGEGKRAGIEGDDGETYWIGLEHLEVTNDAPPEVEVPAKGERVRFELEGVEVEGEVFWVGENKSGRGMRLGVRDAGGEAHWVDARRARPAVEEPAEATWNDEDPPF
ncbi:MAG: hypothetical protein R3F61_04955 [Myxococcota bacterium]